MGPQTWPAYTANGNVSPCRFITPVVSASGGSLAVQASAANQLLVGVSWEGTRYPPNGPADDGLVAIAGEPLSAYSPGEQCNLTLGATVTNANSLLTSDSAGKGIVVDDTSDAKIFVGALALQPGVANDKVWVQVLHPFYQMSVHV